MRAVAASEPAAGNPSERSSAEGWMVFSHSFMMVDMVRCRLPFRAPGLKLSSAGHWMSVRFDGVPTSSAFWPVILVRLILTNGGSEECSSYWTLSSWPPDGVAGCDTVVLPLQRGDLGVCDWDLEIGESQFPQSSSRSSNGGAAKDRGRDFLILEGDLARGPAGASASPDKSTSGGLPVRVSQVRGDIGRGDLPRSLPFRLVLLLFLAGAPRTMSRGVLLEVPLTASSPTVACRRSSRNVHMPVLRSSASCFAPRGTPIW